MFSCYWGKQINVNRADEADLVAVPGIGPGLAAVIVNDRHMSGPFHVIGDLCRIPGIGEDMLRKLEPFLEVGSSVGIDELQDVHTARSLLDPTGRVNR